MSKILKKNIRGVTRGALMSEPNLDEKYFSKAPQDWDEDMDEAQITKPEVLNRIRKEYAKTMNNIKPIPKWFIYKLLSDHPNLVSDNFGYNSAFPYMHCNKVWLVPHI